MGLILYFIASILKPVLHIVNFLLVLAKNKNKRGFFKQMDSYFFDSALDKDKFANREFRTLWNIILIKKSGYKFGNPNETISSVLGKNQRDNTLTGTGRFLCGILDWIDPNHCEKSIKEL